MSRASRPSSIIQRGAAFELLEDRCVPAVLTVTTLQDGPIADDGVLTLREALHYIDTPGALGDLDRVHVSGDLADANVEAIVFDPNLNGGEIQLNGTELFSAGGGQGILIDAMSLPDGITINAMNNSRVFYFDMATDDLDATLRGLTITGGHTTSNGGGIYFNGGGSNQLRMEYATLTQNFAGNDGGGLFSGQLITITNSTISFNSSDRDGAGLWSNQLDLINSTVSNNHAGRSGGGIHLTFGSTDSHIIHSTIAMNDANSQGGGILAITDFVEIGFSNTILLGNTLNGSTPNDGEFFGSGPILGGGGNFSQGGNVFGQLTGDIDLDASDVTGANVADVLFDLADNGGRTQTHALVTGGANPNPAINGGLLANANDPSGNPLKFDQRGPGAPRNSDGGVDAGAFELDLTPPTINNFQFEIIDDNMIRVSGETDELGVRVLIQFGDSTGTLVHSAVIDQTGLTDGKFEYLTPPLPAQVYSLTVRAMDASGNESVVAANQLNIKPVILSMDFEVRPENVLIFGSTPPLFGQVLVRVIDDQGVALLSINSGIDPETGYFEIETLGPLPAGRYVVEAIASAGPNNSSDVFLLEFEVESQSEPEPEPEPSPQPEPGDEREPRGFVEHIIHRAFGELGSDDQQAEIQEVVNGRGRPSAVDIVLGDRRFLQNVVNEMYREFFGRDGENTGIDYWTQLLETGMEFQELLIGFGNSSEFRGELGQDALVEKLVGLLDSHDPTGDVSGQLQRRFDQGVSFEQVVAEFITGSHFAREMVCKAYHYFVQRDPDAGGLTFWVEALVSLEFDLRHLAKGMMISNEFYAQANR